MHVRDPKPLPSDLQGLNSIEFKLTGQQDLEQFFTCGVAGSAVRSRQVYKSSVVFFYLLSFYSKSPKQGLHHASAHSQ